MIKRKDNVSMTVTDKKDRSRRNQFNLKIPELLAGRIFFLRLLQLEDAATDVTIKHVTSVRYNTKGHVALRVGHKCHYIEFRFTCQIKQWRDKWHHITLRITWQKFCIAWPGTWHRKMSSNVITFVIVVNVMTFVSNTKPQTSGSRVRTWAGHHQGNFRSAHLTWPESKIAPYRQEMLWISLGSPSPLWTVNPKP